jgi:hypothetical protein
MAELVPILEHPALIKASISFNVLIPPEALILTFCPIYFIKSIGGINGIS